MKHTTDMPKTFATRAGLGRHRFYGLEFMPRDKPKEYYFLLIEPWKEKAFLRALDTEGNVNLHNFGEIVASGFGDVPDAVKDDMRLRYDAPL